jgi:hypothetical protein
MRITGAGGGAPAEPDHDAGAAPAAEAEAPGAAARAPDAADFADWHTTGVRWDRSNDDASAVLTGNFGPSKFGEVHVDVGDCEVEFAPQSAREPLRSSRPLAPDEVKDLRATLAKEAAAGGPKAADLKKVLASLDSISDELKLEKDGSPLEKAKADGEHDAAGIVEAFQGLKGSSTENAQYMLSQIGLDAQGKAKDAAGATRLNGAIQWLADQKKLGAVIANLSAYTVAQTPGDKTGPAVLSELGRAIAANGTPAVKAAWKAAGGK